MNEKRMEKEEKEEKEEVRGGMDENGDDSAPPFAFPFFTHLFSLSILLLLLLLLLPLSSLLIPSTFLQILPIPFSSFLIRLLFHCASPSPPPFSFPYLHTFTLSSLMTLSDPKESKLGSR